MRIAGHWDAMVDPIWKVWGILLLSYLDRWIWQNHLFVSTCYASDMHNYKDYLPLCIQRSVWRLSDHSYMGLVIIFLRATMTIISPFMPEPALSRMAAADSEGFSWRTALVTRDEEDFQHKSNYSQWLWAVPGTLCILIPTLISLHLLSVSVAAAWLPLSLM